jgi:hypothetical protein
MSVRDLIPWGRSNNQAPTHYRDAEQHPFLTLHREMNRLFDDVLRGFDAPLTAFGRSPGWSSNWPDVEVSESDKELRVTAEVPGLEEKDVEVLLDDGVLTLRGEKRSEIEDRIGSSANASMAASNAGFRWEPKSRRTGSRRRSRTASSASPCRRTSRLSRGPGVSRSTAGARCTEAVLGKVLQAPASRSRSGVTAAAGL